MSSTTLYLASASPRRRELLAQLGLVFEQVTPDVNETRLARETPHQYVQRLALAKALQGWDMAQGESRMVLGADTCIAIDTEILGKPISEVDAVAMLTRLSGKTHEVYSAVALIDAIEYNRLSPHSRHSRGERAELADQALAEVVQVSISRVSFRQLSEQECRAYWRSGEPCDKAGSYAIQGMGAAFVQRLEGSYSGVVGLPLFETAELLQRHGIELLT